MNNNNKNKDFKVMSLGDHLEELRYRLLMVIAGIAVSLVFCLCFGKMLLRFMTKPYKDVMTAAKLELQLQAIQLPEQFLVYIKTSLVFGIILSSPWIFYHLWKFVSAGLYRHEKRFIHVAAPASAALFITGAFFFILFIAPLAITFFIKFNTGIDFVKIVPTLQSYISFVLSLTLIFGVAFQLPIGIIFAEKMGLVSIAALVKSRKFVILGLVIVAAIVTPPDVISQIALAVPLYTLFEGSILVCRFRKKLKK